LYNYTTNSPGISSGLCGISLMDGYPLKISVKSIISYCFGFSR
jgi:hypothetical protein